MDTSKDYIDMCQEATEIQNDWGPKEGDWFFADKVRCLACQWFCVDSASPKEHVFAMTEDIDLIVDGSEIPKERISVGSGKFTFQRWINPVWLPRQDQFQEMVSDRAQVDFAHIIIEIDKMNQTYFSNMNMLEQLWLAFVMKEKYEKVWDGSDWLWEGSIICQG